VGETTAETTPALPADWSPPEYVDRSTFEEVETAVDSERCSLPARLSIPHGDGPVPGAVVVHGSGPGDRDGTTGAVRPYLDLAWGLASAGVAVLRYDKVTAACPRSLSTTTVDSVVVDDAIRAVDRLDARESVRNVTVIGHSLGGALTPRILRRSDDVAGGITLGANARPIHVLLTEQIRQLQRADGTLTDRENETYADLQSGVDSVAAGEYEAAAEVFGTYGLTAEFLQSVAEYDRFAAARATTRPLVLAHGSDDAQVPPEEEFERWRTELADRPNTRFELYDGLNHLFTPAPGGLGGSAYATESHVAGRVVDDLAAALR
jgi:dienelactone hydrolase